MKCFFLVLLLRILFVLSDLMHLQLILILFVWLHRLSWMQILLLSSSIREGKWRRYDFLLGRWWRRVEEKQIRRRWRGFWKSCWFLVHAVLRGKILASGVLCVILIMVRILSCFLLLLQCLRRVTFAIATKVTKKPLKNSSRVVFSGLYGNVGLPAIENQHG